MKLVAAHVVRGLVYAAATLAMVSLMTHKAHGQPAPAAMPAQVCKQILVDHGDGSPLGPDTQLWCVGLSAKDIEAVMVTQPLDWLKVIVAQREALGAAPKPYTCPGSSCTVGYVLGPTPGGQAIRLTGGVLPGATKVELRFDKELTFRQASLGPVTQYGRAWWFDLPAPLDTGKHTVYVRVYAASGNLLGAADNARATAPFPYDLTPVEPPAPPAPPAPPPPPPPSPPPVGAACPTDPICNLSVQWTTTGPIVRGNVRADIVKMAVMSWSGGFMSCNPTSPVVDVAQEAFVYDAATCGFGGLSWFPVGTERVIKLLAYDAKTPATRFDTPYSLTRPAAGP